jgi:hypothetical protein
MAEIVFASYKKIPNPRTCVPLPPSPQPPPVAPTRPLPLPPQIARDGVGGAVPYWKKPLRTPGAELEREAGARRGRIRA